MLLLIRETKILPQDLPYTPKTETIFCVQLLKIPSTYHLCGMQDLLTLSSSGRVAIVSSREEEGTQKKPKPPKNTMHKKEKNPKQPNIKTTQIKMSYLNTFYSGILKTQVYT